MGGQKACSHDPIDLFRRKGDWIVYQDASTACIRKDIPNRSTHPIARRTGNEARLLAHVEIYNAVFARIYSGEDAGPCGRGDSRNCRMKNSCHTVSDYFLEVWKHTLRDEGSYDTPCSPVDTHDDKLHHRRWHSFPADRRRSKPPEPPKLCLGAPFRVNHESLVLCLLPQPSPFCEL